MNKALLIIGKFLLSILSIPFGIVAGVMCGVCCVLALPLALILDIWD